MSNKVYEIITEKIIERMEAGDVPWLKPWVGTSRQSNLISKKEYRGINVFLLGCQNYASPYWLSFKQCKQVGGSVRKGEKSTMIVFWKQTVIKNKDNDGNETSKTIPLLRYYRVFNVEQCDGIDEKKIPVIDVNLDFQPLEQCDAVVGGMQKRPNIHHKEQRAYYSPKNDFVNMPKKESFVNEEFYYAVLFHELGHSTGHDSRLERKKFNEWAPFGSDSYSKEELVAEMTAAFLCGHCQIERETLDNAVAYINSWVRKFKEKPKMVVLAAAAAQKASDYILGN